MEHVITVFEGSFSIKEPEVTTIDVPTETEDVTVNGTPLCVDEHTVANPLKLYVQPYGKVNLIFSVAETELARLLIVTTRLPTEPAVFVCGTIDKVDWPRIEARIAGMEAVVVSSMTALSEDSVWTKTELVAGVTMGGVRMFVQVMVVANASLVNTTLTVIAQA